MTISLFETRRVRFKLSSEKEIANISAPGPKNKKKLGDFAFSNKDKRFMLASMLRSLDTHWQTYLRQKADIENSTMEQIFQILEQQQMVISKPISVRRSEFVTIKQNDGKSATTFLRRVIAKARSSDIRAMTQEEHILLMFEMNLQKSNISQTVRTAVFDYLQKNKSIDTLDHIVATVEQIQSNYVSTQRVTAHNVRRTKEEGYPQTQGNQDRYRGQRDQGGLRDCDLCGGKYYNKKKECRYSCKYCHIRGSHRSSECRGGRRKNNWEYNQEKRFRRSGSYEKSSHNKASERRGTPGKALRIQVNGERHRSGSPNTSLEEYRRHNKMIDVQYMGEYRPAPLHPNRPRSNSGPTESNRL